MKLQLPTLDSLIFMVGLALICGGIAQWSHPWAMIFAGVALAGIAFFKQFSR